MRKLLLAGAALGLMTGVAMAQTGTVNPSTQGGSPAGTTGGGAASGSSSGGGYSSGNTIKTNPNNNGNGTTTNGKSPGVMTGPGTTGHVQGSDSSNK
jgi:hypothetical protein